MIFENVPQKDAERIKKLISTIRLAKSCRISITADMSQAGYSIAADEGKLKICGGSVPAVLEGVAYSLAVFGSSVGAMASPENLIYEYDAYSNVIDNSGLIPEIKPECEVKLVPALKGYPRVNSPEWIADMILAEVHIATAAEDGTLLTAKKIVDFYAEVGVNAIWLCPIYDRSNIGNGYGNRGLHTVDTKYTGCEDYNEGWKVVRDFVDYAHSKNIRILLDIISWGVMNGSQVRLEHPEWFEGVLWGGQAYNWKNAELCEWFVQNAVKNIIFTHADGYRCDCEPNHGGYPVWGRIREKLIAAGRRPLIISEDFSERSGEFDLEQDGVLDYCRMTRGELYNNPKAPYLSGIDIVDSIKSGYAIGVIPTDNRPEKWGRARFYTNCVTNHDYVNRLVRGNCLVIGYQAILAPFIPVWFCGDELGMDEDNRVIYFSPIEWERIERGGKPECRFFFEYLKKIISIRRSYSDIFSYFSLCHRDANICRAEVKTEDGVLTALTGYMRYKDSRAVLVIPAEKDGVYTVEIPYKAAGLDENEHYRIVDLNTGLILGEESGEKLRKLRIVLLENRMGLYLVEKL